MGCDVTHPNSTALQLVPTSAGMMRTGCSPCGLGMWVPRTSAAGCVQVSARFCLLSSQAELPELLE